MTKVKRESLATTAEIAEHLGLALQTLYNWRSQHTGPPCFRVGNRPRYRWADVEAWVDQRAIETWNDRP